MHLATGAGSFRRGIVFLPVSCYSCFMDVTQTVDVPASHRLTIDVPREIPEGPVVLTFTPLPCKSERTETRDVFFFRTGFLEGQIFVPPDFDTMGQEEITALFDGTS
jgi:hypothetical protein